MTMVVEEETTETTVCKVLLYDGNAIAMPDQDLGIDQVQISRPDIKPSTRITCSVVRAKSPSKLCVRRLSDEESFYQLSTDLTNDYGNSSMPVLLKHWTEGASCVAKIPGEGWARAKVDREEEGMVKLLLWDYGVKYLWKCRTSNH